MSALGQKQTFAMQTGMSALPPRADIARPGKTSRFIIKRCMDFAAFARRRERYCNKILYSLAMGSVGHSVQRWRVSSAIIFATEKFLARALVVPFMLDDTQPVA